MSFVYFGLAAIIAANIYIWYAFLRKIKSPVRFIHWIPLIILVIVTVISAIEMKGWVIYILTFLITAVFVPQTIFALISGMGKAVGLVFGKGSHAASIAGISLSGIVALMALYGLTYGWRRIIVKDVPVTFSELPKGFDGYRIVHISDLHLGTYQYSPHTVAEIVAKVNALSPDIVLFTGDAVNISPAELEPFVKVLSRLQARDGVYSIMGNHDYCGYARYGDAAEQDMAIKKLQDLERSAGMDLLLNENRIITRGTDSIALIGVENYGRPPFPQKGDLDKAQKGLPQGIFKILMSHDPSHWRMKILPETDINLTLSGHTHAMQLEIGNFSPSVFIYPEWGGLYNEGNRRLYVNTGTGGNIAFRWGAWPEIDVLELKRS